MRKPELKKPYVICHMIPAVDGRIVTRRWKLPAAAYGEYDRLAATFKADAWLVGRASMAPYAADCHKTVPAGKPLRFDDFAAPHSAKTFAAVIDPAAKLFFRKGDIDGEHVIVITSGLATAERLCSLRKAGVSYLCCGADAVNLKIALQKLAQLFGIKRVLAEGGGKLNGSLLKAGLLDELSLLIAPTTDAGANTPTLFDTPEPSGCVRPLKLLAAKPTRGGIAWLRYKVINK